MASLLHVSRWPFAAHDVTVSFHSILVHDITAFVIPTDSPVNANGNDVLPPLFRTHSPFSGRPNADRTASIQTNVVCRSLFFFAFFIQMPSDMRDESRGPLFKSSAHEQQRDQKKQIPDMNRKTRGKKRLKSPLPPTIPSEIIQKTPKKTKKFQKVLSLSRISRIHWLER